LLLKIPVPYWSAAILGRGLSRRVSHLKSLCSPSQCSHIEYIIFLLFTFFFFFLVSLCSPGCPGSHSVDQDGLELRNPPASASQVLSLKACATTTQLLFTLNLALLVALLSAECRQDGLEDEGACCPA
jgi:hypothetical protein